MQFLVIVNRGVVQYYCHDLRMVHGGCRVITLLSSYMRRCPDHYGFSQFFAGCTFDLAPAYLVYWRPDEINSSSLRPADCWFPYAFNDDRVNPLYATEVKLHGRIPTGELSAPQLLAARVFTWIVHELDRCVIVDAVAHLGLLARSDKAAPSVPLALPGTVVDVLGKDLNAEVGWNLSDIPSSGIINIRSSLGGDFSLTH